MTPGRTTDRSHAGACAVGRDAERARGVDFRADANPPAGGHDLDDRLVVEPGADVRGGHRDAHPVPALVLEPHVARRLVLRRVEAVDAGQPHRRASPPAEDQRAVRGADGKGQRAEKVAARKPRCLERDLVGGRQGLARPGDACERIAHAEHDRAVDDADRAFAPERRLLPLAELRAVEKRRPPGLRTQRAPGADAAQHRRTCPAQPFATRHRGASYHRHGATESLATEAQSTQRASVRYGPEALSTQRASVYGLRGAEHTEGFCVRPQRR